MSERFLCVVGDPTTGGGEALAGTTGFDLQCLDGVMRSVVRIGDPVLCGQCGPTKIISGVTAFWINGPNVAADGSDLACGHKLIAKLQRGFSVSDGTSSGVSEARSFASRYEPAPATATRYSAQFVLRDAKGQPVADFPYVMVNGAGTEFRGRTNNAGETERRYTSIFTRFDLYPDVPGEDEGAELQICREC